MKRLIVICNQRGDYEQWCRDAGLPAFSNFIHSWTPRTRSDQFRGLSEQNIAFVWLARPELGKNAKVILDVYIGLGATQFDCTGPTSPIAQIREWLGYIEETREKKLEAALTEALGMLRVYVSADTTITLAPTLARIRAWGELLKP